MRNKRSTKSYQKAWRRGLFAEAWVALYLRLCNYKIVARRYKTKSGEIDIIARKRDLVLIVEVKASKTAWNGQQAFVNYMRHRVESAADWWLIKQPDYTSLRLRFDLAVVLPWGIIKYYPGFFQSAF